MIKRFFICMLAAVMLIFSLCASPVRAYQSDLVDAMEAEGFEAGAALLVDLDTDLVMYEQNGYERIYPASVTKIMTGLLVMEALEDGTLSLDEMITADDTAWQGLTSVSGNQNIQPGEEMSVEDLLYCMLVVSANEAANILGTAVGGSIEGCVDLMNEKAKELGCTDTHFMNTNGMPDEEHYSTAWDLYLIAKAAMEYDLFCAIVSTAEYTVEPTNLTETTRHFYNTNGLLSEGRYEGYYYEYCIGIKTGTTNAAGNCLLSAAEKDGRTLVCVMMGCENPVDSEGNVQRLQFSQSIELLEWGFSSFSERIVLEAGQNMGQVSVTHAEENAAADAVADGAVAVFLPNDVSSDAFEWTVDLADSVEAPVTEGQILGTATVSLDGESCGTVNLVAQSGVEEVLTFKEQMEELNLPEQYGKLLIVLIVLVVIACVLFAVERKLKYRRNGRSGLR